MSRWSSRLLAAALLALAVGPLSACGRLSIRSWVVVDESASSGTVTVVLGVPQTFPLQRLQGGFLAAIEVDTRSLPAPLTGTVAVEDVRIAGAEPTVIGNLCVWRDPTATGVGTVRLDVLGGTGSVSIPLDLKATSTLNQVFSLPPLDLEQNLDVALGGVTVQSLLDASASGSAEGLFATTTSVTSPFAIGAITGEFTLNLAITNQAAPPSLDADLAAFCDASFAEQGRDIFWGVNTKGDYLLAASDDKPTAPLVIPLAELGATPGKTLRLASVGSYGETTELKDGGLTKLGVVFSSSATVKGTGDRNRIPGAIETGKPDLVTGLVKRCVFIFCSLQSTDIAQDFAVTPTATNVVVPAGATHLVVTAAPGTSFPKYDDNSGFGLGISLEVLP
jgi:hypothetical protein